MLPPTLNGSLKATAAVVVTELFNEGQSAANDPEEWPLAQISEVLDRGTCPLCRAVDGKLLRVDSPAYREWRQPSHVNCRRVMVYVHRDEGSEADFERPSAELIRKHGHFHLNDEKHSQYRIPAEPAGRHVTVRRVVNPETGRRITVLDWAPWHERHSAVTQRLILEARTAPTEAELAPILERLGITDRSDPDQFRRAVLLGLRDRLDGWITETAAAAPAGDLVPAR